MSQRRSRLQRKARRVALNARESQTDEALGKIRAERDKAFFEANQTFDKGVRELRNQLAETRKDARETYEEKRTTILAKFADEEAAA